MKDGSDLIGWAFAIGFSWLILTSMTGLDEWFKELIGRKDSRKAMADQLKALEDRVKELEKSRKGFVRENGGQKFTRRGSDFIRKILVLLAPAVAEFLFNKS